MKHSPPIILITTRNIFDRYSMNFSSDDCVDEILAKFSLCAQAVLNLAKSFQIQSNHKKLSVDDVSEAFNARGFKPFLGYRNKKAIKYETVGQVGDTVISIPVDKQLDLSEIINTPLKETPTEKFFSFHWLAVIRGQQPLIPENLNDTTVPGATHNNSYAPPPQMKLSDQSVQITSTRNEVSQELYTHYYHLIAPNSNPRKKLPLLKELQSDAAIIPLLPYFFHYLSSHYSSNDSNITASFDDRINLARALILNDNLKLDMYLIQIINLSITSLLMSFNDPVVESFSLRENSAELLNLVIKKYSQIYPTLRKRITDHLVKTFIDRKNVNFQVKLGAAIGLSVLGSDVVRKVIIPQFPRIMMSLDEQKLPAETKIQFFKFKSILLKICGDSFHHDTEEAIRKTGSPNLPAETAQMYNNLIPFFGSDFFSYSATKDF